MEHSLLRTLVWLISLPDIILPNRDIISIYESRIRWKFLPIDGIIDDLRIYGICLTQADIGSVYGEGGGDFNRIELIVQVKRELKLIKKAMIHLKWLCLFIIILPSCGFLRVLF